MTKKISAKTLTEEEINFYNKLIPNLKEEQLFALFQILQKLLNDLKIFSFERYIFEFGIFKCANISKIVPAEKVDISVKSVDSNLIKKERKQTENIPEPLDDTDKIWDNFLKSITSPAISSNLSHAYIIEKNNILLTIGYAKDKQWHFNFVNKPANFKIIKDCVKSFFKIDDLKIILEEDSKKKTVVEKIKDFETFKDKQIKKEAKEEPMIKKITEVFGATIENIEVLPDSKIKEE
jgi:DNA polymerase-3 subunit gamma/tau